MAYFNHAFSKAFYAKTQNQTTTETTADLGGGGALGEFAIADASYKIMGAAGVAGTAGGFYLAQSSFQTVDTIGNNPGHGGYSESHKSKMIVKKYISDMWISTCENEAANVYSVIIKPTAAKKSCFPCGTDPILRVDVKGTAALRLLNHNAYQSLSGSLPMFGASATAFPASAAATEPANGVDMCCVEQTTTHSGIAPSIVAINFMDQFNNDPIMSKLGTAKVQISTTAVPAYTDLTTAQITAIYAGGATGVTINAAAASPTGDWVATDLYKVVFSLRTSCELQTQFTSCSFDTRDFYLMGGLKVIADLQDEVGQPCVACQGYVIPAEETTFKQRRTSSETAINDMLLTESYMQSPYNQGNRDSSRFREQEGMSGIVTEMGRDSTTSTCNGMYRVYHLLHSVPRFNNPSGVFDNDQYHYKVYVKCSGSAAAIATIDADWLAIAIDAGVMTFDGATVVSTVTDLETKGGDY
tara:strand:- start:2200 stop:3609 length:1410 start_codon:yes stop_codon:yes gene_type:complete